MTEFELSDYIQVGGLASYIPTEKVKEFIKLRNELDIKFRSCKMSWKEYREERNKLAGDLK